MEENKDSGLYEDMRDALDDLRWKYSHTLGNVNEINNDDCENNNLLNDLKAKYSHQPLFLQAVKEIAMSIKPILDDPLDGDFYKRAFMAMTQPERK